MMRTGRQTTKASNRGLSRKKTRASIWSDYEWNVVTGELVAGPGRPRKNSHLFKLVAEKLPYECLPAVRKHLKDNGTRIEGVYMAHDSMGIARYGGRGKILDRLAAHQRTHGRQLSYFSFYVIEAKNHEREIETAILRAAGPQMILNERKVSLGINPGSVRDYEPRTKFLERQRCRGPKKKRSGLK